MSCDLKAVVVVMFTHGLDIELSVGLLPTLLFLPSAFYPPFRIHFHIFRFRSPLPKPHPSGEGDTLSPHPTPLGAFLDSLVPSVLDLRPLPN